MQKNSYNSLYWKISAAFFVLLAVVGLAYVYITIHYSSMYFSEVNQRLNRNTAADIVSHTSPFTEGKVNDLAVKDLFNHVMTINPSLEIYLLDNNGKILSYYAPVKKIVLDKINLAPVQHYLRVNGNEFVTGDDPRHPEIKKVFSVAPIINNGVQAGYIYVVLASEEYDAVSKNLAASYFLQVGSRAMILTLLATLLIGLFIFRIITKNFTRIIDVMHKFREGDLKARVNVHSSGDEKQLAEMFNEMADILTANIEKLNQVENLRRELIANVSHDLRTPIAIIRGYVETLQMKEETLSSDDRKRYINTVKESTEKLEKLVNELFELSKLEANQVQAKKEPFIISELVSDISNKYQLVAQTKNISICLVLPKELPPVFADVALIERVMQNLIDNALKFTPDGGKITIKTLTNNNVVEVSVTDTGIGVPEKEREQIFARYYRANNFTDLKNSTGLGLAIVKKILDLHASSLELFSKENAGSTFVFQLPIYQSR